MPPVNAGTIYSDVRIQLDKLRGDIQKVNVNFDKFAKTNAQQANTVGNNWKKSFNTLSLVGVGAFVAVSAAAKESVKTFAEFEQSLANVKSVAGATDKEFQKIEDAAKSAGETTRFTASQAADALYSLASAGLDAEESVAALDGVLQLAGATQSDLATTSASVVSTLAQYNLEASEATRVSNVFAAAIGNSQANMDKLTNAFRQVGPVAGALNISLEETTGAIQALLDAGFQGEQAGTALRNILSSLANEADPTTQKLKQLGLSFENLDPTVNGIIDIIGNLNDANLEASQILDAFGNRAGPQILSLLNVGKQGLDEYTKAVTNTNAAAEAYAIQNDTLQGSLDELGSATEALQIGLVKEFAPAIRFVADLLKSLVTFINQLPGPVKLLLGIFVLGVPTIFAVSTAITALTTAMAGLGVSITAVLGPIAAVVGGIAAITAGIVAVNNEIRKARFDDLEKRFGNLAKEFEISNDQLDKFVKTMEGLGAESDLSVTKAITKLKEFQKEVGISDERLDDLVNTAKFLGATSDNISAVTEEVFNLNEEFGATKQAIIEISSAFRFQDSANDTQVSLERINKIATEIGRNLGLTRAEVLKIGLSTKDLTDEYREQLEIAEKSARLQSEIVTTEMRKEIELAKIQRENNERRKAIIEAEAKAQKEREIAEAKAVARSKSIVEARVKAQETYNKTLRISNLLAKENLITRKEAIEKEINATEQLIETLFEIGYTAENVEQTYIDATGKRVSKVQEGNKILRNLIDDILPELKNKFKEVKEVEDFEERNKFAEEYKNKLIDLNSTERERIQIARNRAIAEVSAADLTAEATSEALDALNKYYDALLNIHDLKNADIDDTIKWTEEQQKALNEVSSTAETVVKVFSDVFGAINELSSASAQRRIDDLDKVLNANLRNLDAQLQAALEVAGVAEETREEKLQKEIAEARVSGDTQTEIEKSNELKRLQITEDFEKQKQKAVEETEKNKAQIQYKSAISQWTINLALAVADAARAIITGFAQLGPIGGAIAAASTATTTGIEIAAMNAARPLPPAFKTGGFVIPKGYQTGGIVLPSGSSGKQIVVAENGSPEMMLNAGREGAGFMDLFANRIAAKLKGLNGGNINVTMIMDGRKVAEGSAQYYNNGQVRVFLK